VLQEGGATSAYKGRENKLQTWRDRYSTMDPSNHAGLAAPNLTRSRSKFCGRSPWPTRSLPPNASLSSLSGAANGPAVSDSANGDLAGVVLVRAHEGAPGRRLSSLLLWTEAVAQTIACLDFL
jgi:hypothetical protein